MGEFTLGFLERYNRDENNVTAKIFAGIVANELIPGNEDLQFLRSFLRAAQVVVDDSVPVDEIEVTLFPQADHFGIVREGSDGLEVGEIGDVVVTMPQTIVSVEVKYISVIGARVMKQLKRQRQYLDALPDFADRHQILLHVASPNMRYERQELESQTEARCVCWSELRDLLPEPYKSMPFWGKRNARAISRSGSRADIDRALRADNGWWSLAQCSHRRGHANVG